MSHPRPRQLTIGERFRSVTLSEALAVIRRRTLIAEETRGSLLVGRFADGVELAIESRIFDGPYCPDFAGLSLDAPRCLIRRV